MNRQCSVTAMSFVLAGVVLAAAGVGGRAALVTAGLNKNFQAGLFPDGDGDNQWENTTGNGNRLDWTFVAGNRPADPVTDPAVPAITHTYTFPASTASAASYEFFSSHPASFELWFRPADLAGTHILFETGGNGAGTVFFLHDDTLFFRVQQAPDADHVAQVGVELPAARWYQAVGVIHTDTATIRLYLDGRPVGSATAPAGLAAWAGGNASGLGQVAGTVAGDMSTTAFGGALAILRFYDLPLDAEQVYANYAIVPAPAGSLVLMTLVLACRRVVGRTRWPD